MRWGATEEEWAHFSETLAFTRDLLPVVSNPKAEISSNSKIKTLGKTPSLYNRDGFAVGFPKWTEHEASAADVARWSKNSDYGICVQTRGCRAFDIDIEDPDRALGFAQEIVRDLGLKASQVDVRYRPLSGRLLLPVGRVNACNKRNAKVDGGAVELLADGQQFIAAGTHKSGERYSWMTLECLLDLRSLA